jgi:flavodoxin
MKALVVYESMYGNTATIGERIAEGLRGGGLQVEVGPVTAIGPARAAGVDLLVVGGPTHAHGMSRASTRKTAIEDAKNTYASPTVEPGLREWIEELPTEGAPLAAAFDTRIDKSVVLTGSAAKGIAKRLQRHGYRVVVRPECFLVTTKNRLVDGEIQHAQAWGHELAAGLAGIGAV